LNTRKKFFSFLSKSGNTFERAAHGGAEVTIPGGSQELWRCFENPEALKFSPKVWRCAFCPQGNTDK